MDCGRRLSLRWENRVAPIEGMRVPTPETGDRHNRHRRFLAPLYVLVHHAAPRHQRPSSTSCVSASTSPYAAEPMLVQAFRAIGLGQWSADGRREATLRAHSTQMACCQQFNSWAGPAGRGSYGWFGAGNPRTEGRRPPRAATRYLAPHLRARGHAPRSGRRRLAPSGPPDQP
jgi:hypothetical protein